MACRVCAAFSAIALLHMSVFTSSSAAWVDVVFTRHEINPRSTYSACTAFDVDGDGDIDIVSGGFWYEAPRWTPRLLRDVPTIRGRFDDYSNLPLDVDGDGWTDLVSANYRSGRIYWVEHPGVEEGRVGPWTTHLIAEVGPMETARLADVDGDGRLDVLPNEVRGSASWWSVERVGGSPRWNRHRLPREIAGHGIGFGDIDGDARGDIVGPRGWLRAPEDRREGKWTWHAGPDLDRRASIPILVVDVDSDGDGDIVWARGHGFGLYWHEQRLEDGARTWVRHAIDTSASQFHSLLLADLDGDGVEEVIAGKRYMGHDGLDPGEYDPLVIHRYVFDGKARTWRRFAVSWGGGVGFGLDPEAVDIDADGDIDLVCPGRSGLYLLENRRIVGRAGVAGPPAHERSLPEYPDHSRLLVVRDASGRERPVVTPGDWALRRRHIIDGVERAMGELPTPRRRVPILVRELGRQETERYTRRKITFLAAEGESVPAWVLVPRGLKGPAPAMLCLHQTTRIGKDEPAGLGGRSSLHYAHELARRGFVCMVPDYPSFGEYRDDFEKDDGRWASGSMKAIWNNVRAIDFLESMSEVDAGRIGCIGHSLGGHHSIFSALFDQRIRAVVTSCGFTGFHDYRGGNLAGWASDRYMPRIQAIYGNDPDRVPFDFHELIAALAPRPVFVCAPLRDSNFDVGGVRKVVGAAAEVFELHEKRGYLEVAYPDSAHDFPDVVRQSAYRFLERHIAR